MTDNYTCVWTTEDRETSHQRHQIAPETSHADALEVMKSARHTKTEHSDHTEPIISSGIIPQRSPR